MGRPTANSLVRARRWPLRFPQTRGRTHVSDMTAQPRARSRSGATLSQAALSVKGAVLQMQFCRSDEMDRGFEGEMLKN